MHGSTIYAGGGFTMIGGLPRNYIAELNRATPTVTGWDPNAGDWVVTLATNGGTVYAGGSFLTIGGQSRAYIAALDPASGLATAWDPSASDAVNAVAVSGSTIYAGGYFTAIGGQNRNRIAALDASSGLATGWNPDPNDAVNAVVASGSEVIAGGYFTSIRALPQEYLARISTTTVDAPRLTAPQTLLLEQNAPNPARSVTQIRFTLAATQPVSIGIYDLQGRRVAGLLDHELRPAGAQQVTLRTDGWRAGLYLCRLEAGGSVVTRKLLVVN